MIRLNINKRYHSQLTVELIEAKDIFSKKTEELHPFAVLQSFGLRYRSDTVRRNVMNPFWGATHRFESQRGCVVKNNEKLRVTILAENDAKGKDYPLGEVDVDLARVKEEKSVREWFPLYSNDLAKTYIDGELQLFFSLIPSPLFGNAEALCSIGKSPVYLDINISMLSMFYHQKDLLKRGSISEVFVRFQVKEKRFRTRSARKRLKNDHLFCEHFLVGVEEGETSFDIQLGIYGVHNDPLHLVEVMLGKATLSVSLERGKRKEYFCTFSRSHQPEKGESAEKNKAGRVLMELGWEEIELLEPPASNPLTQCLIGRKYEGLLLADQVLDDSREKYVMSLVPFLMSERHILSFINVVAQSEVSRTLTASVLFRGNTLLTKTIDHLQKMVLRPYLRSVIQPWMAAICQAKVDMELDPLKIDKQENLLDHRAHLLSRTHQFLGIVFQSASKIPPILKVAYATIRAHVFDKFGNEDGAEFTSVSSFFFLRLICPCLISPVAFGLISRPPSKHVTRGLILIVKVIQNLANLVEFGEKEGFMSPLNPFLVENFSRMKSFLLTLGKDEPTMSVPALPDEEVFQTQGIHLARIYQLLVGNLERLGTFQGNEGEEEVRDNLVQAVEFTQQKFEESKD